MEFIGELVTYLFADQLNILATVINKQRLNSQFKFDWRFWRFSVFRSIKQVHGVKFIKNSNKLRINQ